MDFHQRGVQIALELNRPHGLGATIAEKGQLGLAHLDQQFADGLLVLLGGADEQLLRDRVQVDSRPVEPFFGELSHDRHFGGERVHVFQVVDHQLGVLGTELFEGLADQFVMIGPGNRHQLIGTRLIRQFHLGSPLFHQAFQHVDCGQLVDVLHRVELQRGRRVQKQALFDLFDNRLDGVLLGRRGDGHQSVVCLIDRHLDGVIPPEKQCQRAIDVGRIDRRQPMHAEHGALTFPVLAIHLVKRGLDLLVVFRQRAGHDAETVGIQGDLRLWHQRTEHRKGRGGIGVAKPIDLGGHLLGLRQPFGEFGDGLTDGFVVPLVGPDDETVAFGVDHELGVILQHGVQHVQQGLGVAAFDRVDGHHPIAFQPTVGLQLFDGVLDNLMILRSCPGDEFAGIVAFAQFGLGDGGGKQGNGVGCSGRLDVVDHDPGCRLVGFPLRHFLHRRVNDFVIGGTGPGDQLPRIGAYRELGIRRGFLQELKRAGGVHRRQRIDHHLRLHLGRAFLEHSFDDFFDDLVVGRPSPSDHLMGPGTYGQAGLGDGRAQHAHGLGNAGRSQ